MSLDIALPIFFLLQLLPSDNTPRYGPFPDAVPYRSDYQLKRFAVL